MLYRTVKLGGAIEGKRIVRTGLQSGEQIVVNGLHRIRLGMTVAPEQVAETATNSLTTTKVAQR